MDAAWHPAIYGVGAAGQASISAVCGTSEEGSRMTQQDNPAPRLSLVELRRELRSDWMPPEAVRAMEAEEARSAEKDEAKAR